MRARTRGRIADAAAELFAARGYDSVVVLDVARAADVSEQTVYNHFPAKQDLVLDRADDLLERFASAVRARADGVSPADAVRDLIVEPIRFVDAEDPRIARGSFAAQCVLSPTLRRFALEFREQQARAIATALAKTDPGIPAMSIWTHASAIVALAQAVTDAIGAEVIARAAGASDPENDADTISRRADAAIDELSATFHTVLSKKESS